MAYNHQYQSYQQSPSQYPPQYPQQYNNQSSQQASGPRPRTQIQVVVPPHKYHQVQQARSYDGSQDTHHKSGMQHVNPQQQFQTSHGYQQPAAQISHGPPPRYPQEQSGLPAQSGHEPAPPPGDYQLLLMSLADEYLEAAHAQEMLAALAQGEASADQYGKLVATALGCMESVLKNWRLPPLTEARLRLKYARTLFEETENDFEAETVLSKGVELCERNKLTDLKYTMQILLAQVLYRSNPKAAIKSIDRMMEDAEAYRHTAWEYLFRFLRAISSLSMPSHQDFLSAIHHLQKINTVARYQGDQAVFAFSAVLEALGYLQSSGQDSVDQVQRALATARQSQLNPEVNGIPQIQIMIQAIDLCCSLQESHLEQLNQKVQMMQETMDQIVNDSHWQDNGDFYLPLTKTSVAGVLVTGGGLISEHNGRYFLSLTWLPKKDVYALGYFLSAVSVGYKNASDGHKAEKFLEEGIALVRTNLSPAETLSEPLLSSSKRVVWRMILECQCLLERTFLMCARRSWTTARSTLDEIGVLAHGLGDRYPADLRCMAWYLDGAIYQGTGDLKTALSIFQSPSLAIPPASSRTLRHDTLRDIGLLAAMNVALIIHVPSHPSHHLLLPLLNTIEPYLSNTSNKNLQASHNLILSIISTTSTNTTLKTKQYLGSALSSARHIGNAQVTAITLSLMSDKYFRGVLGEQAEKSARAGQAMARKAGDRLWVSVTDGMLAETLERQGKKAEAAKTSEEALRFAATFPDAMQKFGNVGE